MSNKPFWVSAVSTGVLIGLSYPSLPLGFLAWFGFIPLFNLILNSSPKDAGKYSFLSAITANLISLYWIGFNSGAGIIPVFSSLVAAILYLGLYWAAFGYILSVFNKKADMGLTLSPFLWVAMEWLRSFGPLGFPWINLALTQTSYLPLIQTADIGGTYIISFWVIVINIGFYIGYKYKELRRKSWIITSLLIAILWNWGFIRINQFDNIEHTSNIEIAVVQPNIDPNEKWVNRNETFFIMDSLLDRALELKPKMVLWPETALPTYLRISFTARKPLQNKVDDNMVSLLSGTVDRIRNEDSEKVYYNGSIFLTPFNNLQMYRKVQLVPFAEYIPLSEYFPILKKLNFGQANFTQGEEYVVFEIDSLKFSNIICYESSLPNIVRRFVKEGARFITIQANDGFLGNTTGPRQHFELARLRAVENRVAVVRSANTGISGIILPTGKVSEQALLGTQKVFKQEVPISNEYSIYTEYGDKFALISLLISIVFVGGIWIKNY